MCAKSPPSETSLSSSLENSIALERVDCDFPSDTFFTFFTVALKHPPPPQGHFCGSIFTGSTQCLPPVRLSLLSFHCRQLYCDRSCQNVGETFLVYPGENFSLGNVSRAGEVAGAPPPGRLRQQTVSSSFTRRAASAVGRGDDTIRQPSSSGPPVNHKIFSPESGFLVQNIILKHTSSSMAPSDQLQPR